MINEEIPLALWGGVECTLNRVGNVWFDQLEMSGHAHRLEDLDRIAALGIKTLRYPILWEKICPLTPLTFDWRWSDERLQRLRELKIEPIVGFIHHGSGPHYTDLLSPNFAPALASFAHQFAVRYPWVKYYTPINEPLTTARFSGLYGHWYPHKKDNASFARCLLNQIHAVSSCMTQIRALRPDAILVQTEDLGEISGSINETATASAIAAQVEFENHRRWLTFDLLNGKVDGHHPLWQFLLDSGISPAELKDLSAHPCAADIVGINHYVTSNRFLDAEISNYPEHVVGSNGTLRYADVETARIGGVKQANQLSLLKDAWIRYHKPLALTEVHLHGGREDQMRWLAQAWEACVHLKSTGVNVQALTIWSLLGAYDWDSLVTQRNGRYESGVFDCRSFHPRATALAKMISQITRQGKLDPHPILQSPGWWSRPTRATYRKIAIEVAPQISVSRPLLIVDPACALGTSFLKICEDRGIYTVGITREHFDISDPEVSWSAIAQLKPWAIIHTSAFMDIEEAEQNPEFFERAHLRVLMNLQSACARLDIPLVTFSSDLVFDGIDRDTPYLEKDLTQPLNHLGRMKERAEQELLKQAGKTLIIRTGALFSPWDSANFVTRILNRLEKKESVSVVSDQVISPSYVPHLVHVVLDLLLDEEVGIWHLANHGAASWYELAHEAARMAHLDSTFLIKTPTHEMNFKARRPHYSALGSSRATLMGNWTHALEQYFRDRNYLRV